MQPSNISERNQLHDESLRLVEAFKAQGGVVKESEIVKRNNQALSIKEVSQMTYFQRINKETENAS